MTNRSETAAPAKPIASPAPLLSLVAATTVLAVTAVPALRESRAASSVERAIAETTGALPEAPIAGKRADAQLLVLFSTPPSAVISADPQAWPAQLRLSTSEASLLRKAATGRPMGAELAGRIRASVVELSQAVKAHNYARAPGAMKK